MVNKVFCIIYVHTNKGQNNFIRGYAEGIRQLIKTDYILSTMMHLVNGDDPKNAAWLMHNEAGVEAITPGFIIKYPSCLINKFACVGNPAVLGIGYANIIINLAYLMYEYLEKREKVPKVKNKCIPYLTLDFPPQLEDYTDICTISSLLGSIGVIVRR